MVGGRGFRCIGRTPSQSMWMASPVGPERCVAAAIAPTELELLEAEVVPDLVALGMEHVRVAVPDLGTPLALALVDDL